MKYIPAILVTLTRDIFDFIGLYSNKIQLNIIGEMYLYKFKMHPVFGKKVHFIL